MLTQLFQPVHGSLWYAYILGALAVSCVFFGLLTLVPQNLRRFVIQGATFLGGLYWALEFFWPTHPTPTAQSPKAVGNFLTPYVVPFGNVASIVAAFAVGLGVINLVQVHGKRVSKGGSNAFNSAAFFLGLILMLTVGILRKAHPNAINKNLNTLVFDGGLQTMDATMFSIVAFYIVSASYRAFRVRSVEATLLLITATLVMLGQIAVGTWLTQALPATNTGAMGWMHNLRLEIIRDWILTKANAPASRAIAFGLGIGGLAVALRIWLGLERGSYFDNNG